MKFKIGDKVLHTSDQKRRSNGTATIGTISGITGSLYRVRWEDIHTSGLYEDRYLSLIAEPIDILKEIL